jgi:hypothetical protein
MSIDIEQLLALIAARPKIRTVEIAEILDCEPSDVRLTLQRHVDAGTIVAHLITAPNGKPMHEFEMQSQVPTLTDAERAAALHIAPGVDIDKAMTRVGRAIAFIAAHGGATCGQLHGVMGLTYGRTVSTALSGALKDGRVARDGLRWLIGPNQKGCRRAAQAAPVAKPVPEAMVMAGPVAAAPKADAGDVGAWGASIDSMRAMTGAMVGPAGADSFCCAVWSSGSMELRRNGQQLAMLTKVEQSVLRQMLQQGAR